MRREPSRALIPAETKTFRNVSSSFLQRARRQHYPPHPSAIPDSQERREWYWYGRASARRINDPPIDIAIIGVDDVWSFILEAWSEKEISACVFDAVDGA